MMYALSLAALTAVVAAAPQAIDFTQVDEAPAPKIYSVPVLAAEASKVVIQPAASVSAVAAAAVTDVQDVNSKRDLSQSDDIWAILKRDGNCSPQPAGTGPAVNSPDTAAAFSANQDFWNNAISAATPYGYSNVFTNLTGATSASGYMGYKTLTTYSPAQCANYCDGITNGRCHAFNIFYERDPSKDPGANCTNPTSVTNIKCSAWGVPIDSTTATNVGQTRSSFQVVISGSNGYVKSAPPPAQSGFAGPIPLGGAINAPNDPVTGKNTYIGAKFFAFGDGTGGTIQSYDASVCTGVCTQQTNYNIAHPPATGNPDLCNQVNVYVLSMNGVAQGIYCSMYTESWGPQYANNYGQNRGSDVYTVSDSYAYTNNTYNSAYNPICNFYCNEGTMGTNGNYNGGSCGGYGPGTC